MQTETITKATHASKHSNIISVPVLNLPLRPSTLAHLVRCGFASTGDVAHALRMSAPTDNGSNASNDTRYDHFAKELACPPAKAADYAHELDDALTSVGLPKVSTNEVKKTPSYIGNTAASILRSKRMVAGVETIHTRQIVSFCMPLDKLLGGGIPLSELTEIAGLPGSGKTQLAMQLAVDARLPAKQGGVEGCTVVIDSEGSWCGGGTDRLWSMATSLVDHVKGSAQRRAELKRTRDGSSTNNGVEESLIPDWFTAESIMEGVHIFRVHDEAAQTATLYSLPKFLLEQERKGKPIKLLVVDSLAFHYRAAAAASRSKNRYNKLNSLNNTYNLTRMATFLSELATEFEIAVVAMNHMTTRVDRTDPNGSGTKIVPALGESWAHSVTSRLIVDFFRRSNPGVPLGADLKELRTCRLVKSPHKPPGTAMFTITDKGIRGAPTQLADMIQQQQQKRPRLDD